MNSLKTSLTNCNGLSVLIIIYSVSSFLIPRATSAVYCFDEYISHSFPPVCSRALFFFIPTSLIVPRTLSLSLNEIRVFGSRELQNLVNNNIKSSLSRNNTYYKFSNLSYLSFLNVKIIFCKEYLYVC